MKITPKQYAISLYESTKKVDKLEIEKRIKKFVDILEKNNDLSLSDKIINEYNKFNRNLRGVSKIEIASNDKLNSETLNKIIQKFKNQIEIKEKIDKSLIGGMVIKIDEDILIDGSVKRKLEDLKKNIL
ncbi:MAG: F0F1 ATP synthase subunit delta [Candidatus Pacebacteria bacterium]|nr:F0F1 ATP synthase subunit delta [Candidatus Paceibacterota bacterium]